MADCIEGLTLDLAGEEAGRQAHKRPVNSPTEQAEVGEVIAGAVVGVLVGIRDLDAPLVIYPGQRGSEALAARASIDLSAVHLGHEVVLLFENGDPQRPIVTGRLRAASAWPAGDRPPEVDVEADGRRLILNAKEELVLKCGNASITLTAAGKVIVAGAYVSHRSSGVMRINGGSVQIN